MRQTEGARRDRVGVAVIGVMGLVGLMLVGPWRAAAEVATQEGVVRPSGAVEREQVGVSPSRATPENGSEAERYPWGEPQVEPLWKLGRGVHNLAFGLPAEIILNPTVEALKADTLFGFGAGAVEGAFVGIGKGCWRMGAGFLDIVTFPAPTLDPWYDPELLPRYPF